MKSFEFVGKNIEKAIEAGLKELNKNREDVNIEILSEGGIFSKAKVKISFEEETNAKEVLNEEINNIESECEHLECAQEKCTCENCEEEKESACTCEECFNGEEIERESETVETETKQERVYMSSEEVFDKIQEIFKNIFESLKIEAKVMILENDEAYEVKIMGENDKISSLIGYRGEGLNAYQLLVNNFIELRNKSKKILIDVENYRSKREESLRGLAIRIAKKVVKTKRRHKFEPMSSFERHVIHEELANFAGVTTHSEGVDPHRYLIVDIEK